MGLSFEHILILLLSVSVVATTVSVSVSSAFNITDILSSHPEYSDFNRLLSETKIADDINSRQNITVVVLPNSIFSPVAGSQPLPVLKRVLSLHVFLNYFDENTLHKISNGSIRTTSTLVPTTEKINSLVHITVFNDGKVGFGSAAPNSKFDANFTKSVKQIPFKISVIEINAPIIAPGFLTPPPPISDVNLKALLDNNGCKTLSSIIVSTGVIKALVSIADKGLTVFAPTDEAFKSKNVPDLKNLTSDQVVTLLKYHATPSYLPLPSLKIVKAPITTLASTGAGSFELTVSVTNGSVRLHTGVSSSRIIDNIFDSPLLSIFTVDNVLIPKDPLA